MRNQGIQRTIQRLAGCAAVLFLLAGCAASGGQNASYLLEQDYQRMTNVQLTAYEQELSDEISRFSGSGSGMSVGFGLGSWGSHSGFGLGVDQAVGGGGGGGGGNAIELRNRREAVRTEMRSRGLLPPAGSGS
jgi:hypothetical protein